MSKKISQLPQGSFVDTAFLPIANLGTTRKLPLQAIRDIVNNSTPFQESLFILALNQLTFELSHAPLPNTLILRYELLTWQEGVDFTITNKTVNILTPLPYDLEVGEIITATYNYAQ